MEFFKGVCRLDGEGEILRSPIVDSTGGRMGVNLEERRPAVWNRFPGWNAGLREVRGDAANRPDPAGIAVSWFAQQHDPDDQQYRRHGLAERCGDRARATGYRR